MVFGFLADQRCPPPRIRYVRRSCPPCPTCPNCNLSFEPFIGPLPRQTYSESPMVNLPPPQLPQMPMVVPEAPPLLIPAAPEAPSLSATVMAPIRTATNAAFQAPQNAINASNAFLNQI